MTTNILTPEAIEKIVTSMHDVTDDGVTVTLPAVVAEFLLRWADTGMEAADVDIDLGMLLTTIRRAVDAQTIEQIAEPKPAASLWRETRAEPQGEMERVIEVLWATCKHCTRAIKQVAATAPWQHANGSLFCDPKIVNGSGS